jgi:uncharacterized RDD family membrane protein YckC
MDMSVMESEGTFVIAGFWRRFWAFFVDALMVGAAGMIIGRLFYSSLTHVGAPARFVGFIIALAYFGILNSRIGHGQTLTKRWLGIRVVDAQGQFLSLPLALLRYTVFCIPFFFNNLPLSLSQLMSPVIGGLLALIVFGGGFAIVYLYIFNRRTRQSLHDLVVGSYVVRAEPETGTANFASVWRGHLVAPAVVVVLCLGSPLLTRHLADADFFTGLIPLYGELQTQPHVMSTGITRGWASSTGHPTTHYISAQLRLDAPMTEDEDYARSIARILVKGDPHIAQEDVVTVGLAYGFDIGIASWWNRHAYSFKPHELEN